MNMMTIYGECGMQESFLCDNAMRQPDGLSIFQCCRTAYGISPDRNLRDRQVILLLLLQSVTQKDKRCKTGQISMFSKYLFCIKVEILPEIFLIDSPPKKITYEKSQPIWDRLIHM